MNDEQYRFGHIAFPKRNASKSSWWIGLSREELGQAVKDHEEARMRSVRVILSGENRVIGTNHGKA